MKYVNEVELYRKITRYASDDMATLDDIEDAIESCEDYIDGKDLEPHKSDNDRWIPISFKEPLLMATKFNGKPTPFYMTSDEVLGWSEANGYVFVYYSAERQTLGKWRYGWFFSDREYGREDEPCDDIIAWMPLPGPYNGDEK